MPASSASSPTKPPSSASSAPILADTHDEWTTDERRYLSEGSMAKIGAKDETETVALTERDR